MSQVSISVHDYETMASDSDMDDSSDFYFEKFSKIGMVKLQELGEDSNSSYEAIKRSFLVGMGFSGMEIKVVGIHKNNSYNSINGQMKLEAFRIFAAAVAEKRGGDANIKYAWYGGGGGADEICEIICHGFGTSSSYCNVNNMNINNIDNDLSHGIGVVLSPANVPMDSALRAEKDGNGVRHVLLCRVILGNTELISAANSKQFEPSSTDFDTGVDNHLAPTKYIVWRAYMNSHIFPNYIISFTADSLPGSKGTGTSSPRVQLPIFLDELSKFVHPSKMSLVLNYYNEFMQNKSDRSHLIRRLRSLVGDKLLISVIKSFADQLT